MLTSKLRGASLAILSVMIATQPIAAEAQMAPGSTTASPATYAGTPAAQAVLVRDDPQMLRLRDAELDKTFPNEGKHLTIPREATRDDPNRFTVPLEQWDALYGVQHQAEYTRVAQENDDLCSLTGAMVTDAMAISADYASVDAEYASIQEEVAKLPAARKRGTFARILGGIVQVVLGFTVTHRYGAMVAAGAFGNEAVGQSSDAAMRVNNRMAANNLRHSRVTIQHDLLTMRMDLMWVKLIDPWCTRYHQRATDASYATAH